ncbi:MAG: hypothetical protein JXB04_08365 [Kiritimatiellae bacterium]|nr:hypothetical protein [Kiritimatiellia bacterium]
MLDRMEGPERAEGLKRDYASGLRAQVHREKGELVEALEQFERTTWDSAHLDRFFSPFFKMGLERFVRAEVLHEMGRHEEALGWTSSFNLGWNMLFVYRAPIHLRQAEYHESLGHTDEAIEHYSRFVDCWKDCDEGLRPLVEEARSRLEDLKPPEP